MEGGREDSAIMEKQLVREDNPRSLGFTLKV